MLILMLIFAHLVSDYIFQTKNLFLKINYNINDELEPKFEKTKKTIKEKLKSPYIYLHMLIHFIVMIINMIIMYAVDKQMFDTYDFCKMTILILTITISHFIIDVFFKGFLDYIVVKIKLVNLESVNYIVDQIIHLIVIISMYTIMYRNTNDILINLIKMYQNYNLWKIYFYGIIFIFQSYFIGFLIDKIFIDIKNNDKGFDNVLEKKQSIVIYIENDKMIKIESEEDNDKSSQGYKKDIDPYEKLNPGFIIGLLERITMSIFLIMGLFQGVILVLTLKTFSRYNELKKKSFVEKFIIGTMISILSSLIVFLWYSVIM